jgi:RHS repeat-associated protein
MKLTFAYSSEGRRTEKKVYTWDTATRACDILASDTRFVYDGWNLIAEVNATTNTPIRNYFWGQDMSGSLQGAGGVGGLVAMTATGSSAGTYLYAYDANGNILGLVNNQGGNAATYEYGPFGEVLEASGPYATANPIRFSTTYEDPETGLNNYGHRYYNPSTGRFLNRDPSEEFGGYNLYAIANNDLILFTDYLGFACSWKVGVCKRPLWWPSLPSTVTVHGLMIHVPSSVYIVTNNAFGLSHWDVRIEAYSGPKGQGNLESSEIRGFTCNDSSQAGLDAALSLIPFSGVSGWVPGHTFTDPNPGPPDMKWVDQSTYNQVKKKMETDNPTSYNLLKYNCQSWAKEVLGNAY